MSPKRKIPSRKLPSRKFSSTTASRSTSSRSTSSRSSAAQPKRPARPPMKANPAASSAPPQPTIAPCFWEMGFESIPTMEELRQRYKELSLVLHPDAGGNKQSFVDLRTNYEAAQQLLKS